MPSGKSRRVGSSTRCLKTKRLLKRRFNARHIDQVYEDFSKPAQAVHDGVHGPVGTSSRVELDEDLPAHGRHFCLPCSKYFTDQRALNDHLKGKPHKRRSALLRRHKSEGSKPHTALDAEAAGGMGAPDNGPKLRNRAAASLDVVMQ